MRTFEPVVRNSDVIYCDETGFPVDGDQHWVWTFVTDEDVFYTVDESRGSRVLEDVLGEFVAEDATLSCDGWSAYLSCHGKLQQCWAHLQREAKYVAERHEAAEPISEVLHALHETVSTMTAMWERQGLDLPDQLASILGGERPEPRVEASTKEPR